MTQEQIRKYFERIGFDVQPKADLATLAGIQQRHTSVIPFENLNPLLRIPVELSDDSIFQKLVISHRGGYCFEHNILLMNVLKTIGFEVRGLLGRAGEKEYSVGRTHMILLVSLDGKQYIVDTGYGGLVPTGPLLLLPDLVQKTPNEDYRLINFDEGYRLEIDLNGEWKRLYDFDLQQQVYKDYEVGNWYTSTSPYSSFTKRLTAARSDEHCRYTIKGQEFTRYFKGGGSEKRNVNSLEEMKQVLENDFLINLSGLTNLERLMIQ